MDIRDIIQARHSTRRYTDRRAAETVLEQLATFARATESLGPPTVRVAQVNGREQVAHILSRTVGSYGLVQGAPHLLVGLLSQDTPLARLNLGYVLEQVVLEATRLGLGSCWITGTYHPEQAAQQVELKAGETVAAVVTMGTPRQDPGARLHDGIVRRIITAHRRRPLAELVFSQQWGTLWQPQETDSDLKEILEGARWAPSATNQQPWRFVVEKERLGLALTKSAPIDGGIAMAHVTLVAAALGRPGRWTVQWDDPALAAAWGLPPEAVPVGWFSFPTR